jgi:hypothetical protein
MRRRNAASVSYPHVIFRGGGLKRVTELTNGRDIRDAIENSRAKISVNFAKERAAAARRQVDTRPSIPPQMSQL